MKGPGLKRGFKDEGFRIILSVLGATFQPNPQAIPYPWKPFGVSGGRQVGYGE